jgi:catechol 2,3-dioxygenase-like lactoylglutathione lyase family enzyme
MFSHVMLGATDLEKSKKFYDAVLGALGAPAAVGEGNRYFYMTPTGIFAISLPINGEAAGPANGGTVGFAAADMASVEAFHAAGLANGGTSCEDPPGIRQSPFGPLGLAYLRDPAGNKICAMHRAG